VPKFLTVLVALLCALCVLAMPAGAATKKLHLFSKSASSKLYNADGTPITDTQSQPPVGAYFIGSGNDYVGNHKKHSKRVYATDHLICTFTSFATTGFSYTALCDGQIALPGGMVIADRQTATFGNTGLIPLTGGTGRYAKLKSGQVFVNFYSQHSNNSDLTITLRY
jgi:hypothetical protein